MGAILSLFFCRQCRQCLHCRYRGLKHGQCHRHSPCFKPFWRFTLVVLMIRMCSDLHCRQPFALEGRGFSFSRWDVKGFCCRGTSPSALSTDSIAISIVQIPSAIFSLQSEAEWKFLVWPRGHTQQSLSSRWQRYYYFCRSSHVCTIV